MNETQHSTINRYLTGDRHTNTHMHTLLSSLCTRDNSLDRCSDLISNIFVVVIAGAAAAIVDDDGRTTQGEQGRS